MLLSEKEIYLFLILDILFKDQGLLINTRSDLITLKESFIEITKDLEKS